MKIQRETSKSRERERWFCDTHCKSINVLVAHQAVAQCVGSNGKSRLLIISKSLLKQLSMFFFVNWKCSKNQLVRLLLEDKSKGDIRVIRLQGILLSRIGEKILGELSNCPL